MKLSISLPNEDVEYLDELARGQGYASRSAVVHRAVRLLRAAELGADYESAWEEWQVGDEAEAWESTAADGLDR